VLPNARVPACISTSSEYKQSIRAGARPGPGGQPVRQANAISSIGVVIGRCSGVRASAQLRARENAQGVAAATYGTARRKTRGVTSRAIVQVSPSGSETDGAPSARARGAGYGVRGLCARRFRWAGGQGSALVRRLCWWRTRAGQDRGADDPRRDAVQARFGSSRCDFVRGPGEDSGTGVGEGGISSAPFAFRCFLGFSIKPSCTACPARSSPAAIRTRWRTRPCPALATVAYNNACRHEHRRRLLV
jgi:hypothetical protein